MLLEHLFLILGTGLFVWHDTGLLSVIRFHMMMTTGGYANKGKTHANVAKSRILRPGQLSKKRDRMSRQIGIIAGISTNCGHIPSNKPPNHMTSVDDLSNNKFNGSIPHGFVYPSSSKIDTNGNPIFPGGRFYIMPSIFGAAGGGVRLGVTGNSTCPVTVLQDYSEVVNGIPVQFKIPGISPGIIFEGITPLNIVFVEKPECAESSKWIVVSGDRPRGPVSVGIGGFEDHEGKGILEGDFSIEKYGFGYKLVFCPTSTAPPGVCYDIGRYDDENGRRLILTNTNDDPYEVVFVDAGDVDDSSI